jgi:hypothetical protein
MQGDRYFSCEPRVDYSDRNHWPSPGPTPYSAPSAMRQSSQETVE